MRTRFRLLVSAVVLGAACVAAVGHASAAEWPASRQFLLAQPPAAPVAGSPEPSSVAEEPGGSLLVLMDWPVTRRTRNGIAVSDRTRVVRIAPDGSRAFVPPFGDGRVTVDDEILPLPDGSILFTRYNAIDRLRPNGSITRFAGTGRYSEASSGDGGPATAAGFETPHGLARFPDGSIAFAERSRIRRVAPDGVISTIAGSGEYGFAGDGGPATAARPRRRVSRCRSTSRGFPTGRCSPAGGTASAGSRRTGRSARSSGRSRCTATVRATSPAAAAGRSRPWT